MSSSSRRRAPLISVVPVRREAPRMCLCVPAASYGCILRLSGRCKGKERYPDMTITCVVIQMVEKFSQKSDKAGIITKACVTELFTKDGAWTGSFARRVMSS